MLTRDLARAEAARPSRLDLGRLVERHIAYILILPTLLGILLVNLYPLIYTLIISFQEYKLTSRETQFIGLENYQRILADLEVWHAIRISIVFTVVSVSLSFAIGLLLALLLNRPLRGRGVIRSLFIVPWAIPAFVAALGWAWIYNDQFGILTARCASLE